MYMTYDALMALPLATRQQLATLRVLARIDRRGFDHTGPVEQLAQLAAINAGDEDAIADWLDGIDFDEMADQDGFSQAFWDIVEAVTGPAKKTRAQKLAEQLGLEDWEAEQLARELDAAEAEQ